MSRKGTGKSKGTTIELSQAVLDVFASAEPKTTPGVQKLRFTEEMDAVIMHPEIGWEAVNQHNFVMLFKKAFRFGSYNTIKNRYRELKGLV